MEIVHVFSGKTNKEKESIQDCQDALQVKTDCFAIADGASDGGAYPEIWADLLVNHFCEKPNITNKNWQEWLKPIQESWLNDVKEKIKTNKENKNPSWFGNHKKLHEKKLPAGSTFIGAQFKENRLHVTLIGDSCMFIWQDNELVKSMPYTKSTEFSGVTKSFVSFEKDNKFEPQFIQYPIQKAKETYCVLATDAFAKWIFENVETKKSIFERLINISTQNQFEEIVASARVSEIPKLENDDVALIVVKISETKRKVEQTQKLTTKNKEKLQESKSTIQTKKQLKKTKKSFRRRIAKRLKMFFKNKEQ